MIELHALPAPTLFSLPNTGGDDDPVTTLIISNPSINISTTPIVHPTACSVQFPNVVDTSVPYRTTSVLQFDAPRVTILHGHQGTPMQTSAPASTPHLGKGSLLQSNLQSTSVPHSHVDAPWDQFEKSRDTFTHAPPSCQRILCNCAMNPPPSAYNIGAHWMHYTLDPNETHPIVDLVTKSIPPWHAYCPDHDTELLHFPAAVLNVYVD